MNKKNVFISVTAVTVTVVAGFMVYRHVVIPQLDKWLGVTAAKDPGLQVFLQDFDDGAEDPAHE